MIIASVFLAAASAATFSLPPPEEAVVGQNLVVQAKASETLLDIARRYDLGYGDITMANPDIDPWLPKAGSSIIIPAQYVLPQAPRKGIVVNLAEMRLYYFPKSLSGQPGIVITHPIGIGREGWLTPQGKTSVIGKKKN